MVSTKNNDGSVPLIEMSPVVAFMTPVPCILPPSVVSPVNVVSKPAASRSASIASLGSISNDIVEASTSIAALSVAVASSVSTKSNDGVDELVEKSLVAFMPEPPVAEILPTVASAPAEVRFISTASLGSISKNITDASTSIAASSTAVALSVSMKSNDGVDALIEMSEVVFSAPV